LAEDCVKRLNHCMSGMTMKSIKPRKQRKELFTAPQHKKRKWMGGHLEENLLLKYDKRAVPVIKGDTVKVMRGSFRGHEDKIVSVNVKKQTLEIEGIIMTKADGKKIAKPIHSSNVLITKLNLTDQWRRGKLERGLSEEAKKEIEKEAAQQLKEAEEALAKAQEEKQKQEEEESEDVQESVMKEESKKSEDKKETSVKSDVPTKKASPKKATTTKKTTRKKAQKPASSKKVPSTKKKTTTKKTPPKSTKKKGEEKK